MDLSHSLVTPCWIHAFLRTQKNSSKVFLSYLVSYHTLDVIALESKPSPCHVQHTVRKGKILVTSSLSSIHFTI